MGVILYQLLQAKEVGIRSSTSGFGKPLGH